MESSVPKDVESPLPLHPLTYEILLILLDGPVHAYRIVKRIEKESGGGPRVLPANLYRRLRDMLDAGWIEELPVPEADRRHRDFQLTSLGRGVLSAEVRRLEAAVAMARGKGMLPRT
jgi:DNA-binding PadR family transcriptional regulator